MGVLDAGRTIGGVSLFYSDHPDEVIEVKQAYPNGQPPEDYLSAFQGFITENRDQLPALVTVLTRPGVRYGLNTLRAVLINVLWNPSETLFIRHFLACAGKLSPT